MYIQLLSSVVLFCSNRFICNSKSCSPDSLNRFKKKRPFFSFGAINRFVIHMPF